MFQLDNLHNMQMEVLRDRHQHHQQQEHLQELEKMTTVALESEPNLDVTALT